MIIGNCPVCGAEMRVGTDMTNADRIRSMTDEELAEFFLAIQNDIADFYDSGHAFEPDFPTHKNAWIEWLKAETNNNVFNDIMDSLNELEKTCNDAKNSEE